MTLFYTLTCLDDRKCKNGHKMDANRLNEVACWVVKYLQNKLTPEESKSLEEWRKVSERHEEEFKRLCSEEFLDEQRQRELLFSVSGAKERFRAEMKKSASKHFIFRFIQIAAACVLLIGSSWLYFSGKQDVSGEAARITCGGPRARLTLGNGQVIDLKGKSEQLIGKTGVVLDIGKDQLRYTAQGENGTGEYNTLEVPRRGEYRVVLADGTKVWLNSETVLRYPQTFPGENRNVYLSGEAYFEVSPDAEKPFIVHLDQQKTIKVLGTAFNVRAYKEETAIATTLVEGKVCLQSGTHRIELSRGEQAVWNSAENNLTKQKVDVRPYTAWKEGRFVFRKERLENIMKTVSRWYDVNVVYVDEEVKNLSFSGNVERYDDFDKILAMLEMTRMVNFKVEKNSIFISEIK